MVGRSFLVLAAVAALATLVSADAADATRGNAMINIAGHKHLAGTTGLVNKNTVVHGNNIAVAKSNILARQNDDISFEADEPEADADAELESEAEADGGKDAPAAAPMEIIETDETEALTIPEDDLVSGGKHHEFAPGYYGYRRRFYYRYGDGFRYGWRYSMPYWDRYGRGLYGSGCGYGRAFGGYYYC